MSCNNLGDELLETALQSPPSLPSNLVGDAVRDLVENRLRAIPEGMTEEEYRDRVSKISDSVVADIGERAMAKVLEAAGHVIIAASDKHDGRPEHRLLNDFTTIGADGSLNVFEVKSTARAKELKRTNSHGGKNLPKPSLSKTKDGNRQLSHDYNLIRMLDILSFEGDPPSHGEGAFSYSVKLHIASMTYQIWETDEHGKAIEPLGPQLSAAAEIAEAVREELTARGEQWP